MYSAAATASFGSKPFLFASPEVFTCDRNIHQRDASSQTWWIGMFWGNPPEWRLISLSLPAPSWPVSCSAPLPTVLFSDKRYFLNSHQFTFVDVIVSTIVNFSAFTKSLTLSIESVICLDDSHCVGATSSCNIHMSLLQISKYRFCYFPATRI